VTHLSAATLEKSLLAEIDQLRAPLGSRQFLQVRPRDKDGWFCRLDDQAAQRLLARFLQKPAQGVQRSRIQDIGRASGAVEANDRNSVVPEAQRHAFPVGRLGTVRRLGRS